MPTAASDPICTTTVTIAPGHVWDVEYIIRPDGYYGEGIRYEVGRITDTIFGSEIEDVSTDQLDLIDQQIAADRTRATTAEAYDEWADDLEAAFALETDWRAAVPDDVPGFPWL